ncbi:MAG: hypothetical protein JRN15_04410 [Nitrososphaerota archaeon]|nr:hypothetical protein [Nitrososphaerota archaeon]
MSENSKILLGVVILFGNTLASFTAGTTVANKEGTSARFYQASIKEMALSIGLNFTSTSSPVWTGEVMYTQQTCSN